MDSKEKVSNARSKTPSGLHKGGSLKEEEMEHIIEQSRRGTMEQKMKAVQTVFSLFDKDNNGSISRTEIVSTLKESGLQFTSEQVSQFVKKLDADGNGEVDYKEFCALMKDSVCDAISTTSQLRNAFDMIDENQDGQIDTDELYRIGLKLGQSINEEEVKEVMSVVDKDGDGTINFDEFVTMMYLLDL